MACVCVYGNLVSSFHFQMTNDTLYIYFKSTQHCFQILLITENILSVLNGLGKNKRIVLIEQ